MSIPDLRQPLIKELPTPTLETYLANLKEGAVFSKNNYGESTILKFGMKDSDELWVMCSISIGWKSLLLRIEAFN